MLGQKHGIHIKLESGSNKGVMLSGTQRPVSHHATVLRQDLTVHLSRDGQKY